MNAQANITVLESYRFEIGQAVDHVGGKMRSVIVGREITLMGRENYHVEVAPGDAAGRPYRIVSGTHLVAV